MIIQYHLACELNCTYLIENIKQDLQKMSRHRAGLKIQKLESSLNHFHKVMLPRLMFNYYYCPYFYIKQLEKQPTIPDWTKQKKIAQCQDISKTKNIPLDTILKFHIAPSFVFNI